MNAGLLPSSTVLATFTADNAYDDAPLCIEIRPRMSPFGYVVKGFDAYHIDMSTGIGADTVLGAIEAALAAADAMGWEGYTLTEDGVKALAAEAAAAYFDELASVADADADGLVRIELANPAWSTVFAGQGVAFEGALRAAFDAALVAAPKSSAVTADGIEVEVGDYVIVDAGRDSSWGVVRSIDADGVAMIGDGSEPLPWKLPITTWNASAGKVSSWVFGADGREAARASYNAILLAQAERGDR